MNLLSLYKEQCPICKGTETDCFTEYEYPQAIKCKCRACGHKWLPNKKIKPTDNVLFPIGKLPFTFKLGKGKKLTFNKVKRRDKNEN